MFIPIQLQFLSYGLQRPFSHLKSSFQVMNAVIEGKRPEIPISLPDPWKKLIEKCWDGNPSKRYTFKEIVDELETGKYYTPKMDLELIDKYKNYLFDKDTTSPRSIKFRKSSKKIPSQTGHYIKFHPDADIEDVLSQEDLYTAFRKNNPYLIGYFLGKERNKPGGELRMKKIIKHIMETKNKEVQKKFFSLYQMSNTCLHRAFADSTELIETIFEYIDQTDIYKQYAFGEFSRILSRAIDLWPEEIWYVFWKIKGALPKVIKNLDSTCIYKSIIDRFNQKNYYNISNLMWYIFLSFIPSERAQKYLQKPPSFTIFISPVDDLKNNKDLLLELHNSLKKCHKLNLISLLIEYFKCMSDKINEFKYIVLDFVATAKEDEVNEEEVIEKDGEQQTVKLELYPRLFEIAKYIGDDKDVINKALEVMRLCDDTSSLKFQYCIQYLSICYDVLELDQINEIVERSLNEKSRQFTITSILNLVSFVIEDDECFIKQFKRKTIAKVIKLWRKFSKVHINNQAPETQNSFLLLDSILTIGRIIYNSEVNNIIQKYIGIKLFLKKCF